MYEPLIKAAGVVIVLVALRLLLAEPFAAFVDALLAIFEKTSEIVRSSPTPAQAVGGFELIPRM